MLLFIKCFGNAVNETLIIVLDAGDTWKTVKTKVSALRPNYVGKRYLFSGRELTEEDDDKSLSNELLLNKFHLD